MPQEKNFSYYLQPLGKHTALFLLLPLLGLVAGLIFWALTFPGSPYEAESLILFKFSNTGQLSVQSDPQYADTTVDVTRQQKNTVLLAGSMEVADTVLQKAKTSTEPDVKALGSESALDLRDRVSAQLRGDFVSVRAKASTAAAATWLANTWAQEAVSRVNTAYASPSPNVDKALEQVRAQLNKDQKALQDFMLNNPINSLSQQITQTTTFLAAATNGLASNSVTLFDAQHESIRNQITDNYSTLGLADQELNSLKALRNGIVEGPDDQTTLASNQVALILAFNKIASTQSSETSSNTTKATSEVQTQLQVSVADVSKSTLTKSSQLSQLDATVSSLQKLKVDLQTQTSQLEAQLISLVPTVKPGSSDPPAAIQQSIDKMNQLESDLEKKQFELSTLRKTRDLDQTTLDLLRSRLAEQQVNQLVSGIVDVGVPANEEETARSRSSLRALVVAVGVWILLGIALAFGLAYLFSAVRPSFSSNLVLRRRFHRALRRTVSPSESG